MQNSENQATKANQSEAQNEKEFNQIAVFINRPDGELELKYVSPIEALGDHYEIVPANCLDGEPQMFLTLDGKAHEATKDNIKAYFSELAQQACFEQIEREFKFLLAKADADWQDANNFCETVFEELTKVDIRIKQHDPETGEEISIESRYARAFGLLQNKFVEVAGKLQGLKHELWQAKREHAWAMDYLFAGDDSEIDENALLPVAMR